MDSWDIIDKLNAEHDETFNENIRLIAEISKVREENQNTHKEIRALNKGLFRVKREAEEKYEKYESETKDNDRYKMVVHSYHRYNKHLIEIINKLEGKGGRFDPTQ